MAAGWFGLNTWLGGAAIHQMLRTLGVLSGAGAVVPWLGITASQVAVWVPRAAACATPAAVVCCALLPFKGKACLRPG